MCSIGRTVCLRSRLSPCNKPHSCHCTRCVCCVRRCIRCWFVHESQGLSVDAMSCRSPLRIFGAAGSSSAEKHDANLSKPSKSSQPTSKQVRHFTKAQPHLGKAVGRAQDKCHGSASSTSIKKHSKPQNPAAAVSRAPWWTSGTQAFTLSVSQHLDWLQWLCILAVILLSVHQIANNVSMLDVHAEAAQTRPGSRPSHRRLHQSPEG